jgi:hypothetical protein
MRRLALVLLVLGAAGCGGSGGPSTWTETYTPCSQQTPPCVAPPPGGHAAGEASARQVVARSVVAPLLEGVRPAESTEWATLDGRHLGLSLSYRLDQPRRIRALLPYVAIPPDAPAKGQCVHPYAQGWLNVDARGVDRLSVLVDARRDSVVEVSLDSGVATYSWAPGRPHPLCEENQSG